MPANNAEQVAAGIREWLDAAQLAARCAKKVAASIKFDEAVGQNWNNLDSDFGGVFVDATDDTLLLDGARQTFAPGDVQKLENALKELADFFNGNTVLSETLAAGTPVVEVTAVPITRILEVLDGAV